MCNAGAAVQRKLHGGFHWTELYLGALLALLSMLGAALLYWEWQQHKRKKDLARTAENLRFNADTAFLKRLIGQVRGWQRQSPLALMLGLPSHAQSTPAQENSWLASKQRSSMPGCMHAAQIPAMHAHLCDKFALKARGL